MGSRLYWDNGKENGNYYSILGLYGVIFGLYLGYIGVIFGLYWVIFGLYLKHLVCSGQPKP